MTRKELTESEESEAEERSSSDEDTEHEDRFHGQKQLQQGMTEYEKQRLSRIAENRARMEALGLTKLASSFVGSSRGSSKRKGKSKVVEEDEEYMPNYQDERADDDDDDGEEEHLGKKSSGTRKKKGKSKGSKSKKVAGQMSLSGLDYVEDDDELMKAIALSLQDSAGASCLTHNERKKNAEDTGRQKRKKSFTSRVQMTEDELVIHFYQFDESGKGGITVRDLQKIALAHDFMWTDEELADMIRCFDGDGDGMLNLDDFRKIISRCNMLRGSDTS